MRKLPISFVLALLVVVLLSACKKDNLVEPIPDAAQDPSPEPVVEASLEEHLNAFVQEGLSRGVDVRSMLDGLTMEIADIEEEYVAGSCLYHSHSPNQVTIDRDFWNSAGHLLREMVVFHELGHCVLARDHREAQDGNGTCLSIMRSGVGSCREAYTNSNRVLYLDELFDQEFAGSLLD